ncbi:MAG: hypothetical protein N2247_01810 [Leptospiraceae bacterium]|nr:hypothetical protein [Leptospiraceae bacterium]
MKTKFKIILLLMILIMGNQIFSQQRTFIGYAYDINTNKLLYTENHTEFYYNNKHIKTILIYRDKENKKIAEKISDYTKNSQIPLFHFKDFRNGYEEGSVYENNQFKIYFIENNKKNISKSFPFKENIVLDSGFHKFIQNHFDELLNNKTLTIEFAVPSRLTLISFKVYKVKEYQKDNKKIIRFIFEVDNFVFRLLVKPIYIDYDKESKELLQYTGISNLYDENNKAYNVKIIFKYN